MSRVVAIGALCLALSAVIAASYLLWRNGKLGEDLAAAERALAVSERQVEQAREAAAVLDAHLGRMQGERQAFEVELQNLRQSEGYDAPLSPFLRNAYDRM